jgi:hypothetical protein
MGYHLTVAVFALLQSYSSAQLRVQHSALAQLRLGACPVDMDIGPVQSL